MKLLVAISGPSGSGQSSLLEGLEAWMRDRRQGFHVVPSYTSRPPRPGEVEGRPYHFQSSQWMCNAVAAWDWAEGDEHKGHFYGTMWGDIDAPGIGGKIITVPGLEQILETVPRVRVLTVRIVLDRDQLFERLWGRGEKEDFIRQRLEGVPANGMEWNVDFAPRWDVTFYNRTGMIEHLAAALGNIAVGRAEQLHGEWTSERDDCPMLPEAMGDGGRPCDNANDVDGEGSCSTASE